MDLSTRYLSASPLTDNLDNLKRLEDAGAPMAVLRSLFEEQIAHESGAVVCHLCSALLQKGPGLIGKLKSGLAEWLEAHEYHSLRQMRGSMSLVNCPNPAALERANYLQALYSWESP
ncbi:MAG: hypothetical protein HZA02_08140 [Nitrospinae bacterium]|nr:hypothetical protein [Nitrospinota bacterium]